MKFFFWFFLSIFSFLSAYAQNAFNCSDFQLAFGTASYERGYDIAHSGDDIFLAGITRVGGNDDVMVSKMTSGGAVIWSRYFGGNNAEAVRKISPTSDGGILVVGQTQSYGSNAGEILAFKLSASGTLVWARQFSNNSANGDLGMDIIETSDGGLVISGILNVVGLLANSVIIKLDNAANISWTRYFDHNNGDDGVGVIQDGNRIIAAMDLESSSGNYEFALTVLDLATGAIIQARKYTAAVRGLFNPYLFKNPLQPGYIVSGHTITGNSYANMKHTVIYIDPQLNVVQTRLMSFSIPLNDFFTDIAPLPDGSFVGCASPQSNSDSYVYRIAADGSVVFAKRFDHASANNSYRLSVNGSSAYIIGGITNNTQEDFLINRVDLSGNFTSQCSVLDVGVTVEQPAYTSNVFSWPVSNSLTFNSPNLNLAEQTIAQNLTVVTELCKKPAPDFSFRRDSCEPYKINFQTDASNLQSFSWDFGNGITNSNNSAVSVDYESEGNYTVKFSITSLNGCSDSVAKVVPIISMPTAELFSTSDTTICPGSGVPLSGAGTGCVIGNGITHAMNDVVFPLAPTTYYQYDFQEGPNLVSNGSFESGNTGFSSELLHQNINTFNGAYNVVQNPNTWNPVFPSCFDHTTGVGNMLVVNGDGLKESFWMQTIAVASQTNYRFSYWVQTLSPIHPPQIKIFINGASVAPVQSVSPSPCSWSEFAFEWNSGLNTSADISMSTTNDQVVGNDFAVDDIVFNTVNFLRDSLSVGFAPVCDSITISGPEKVCSLSDTVNYDILKPASCAVSNQIEFDPVFVDVISASSNLIQLKFKQTGSTTIRVRNTGQCTTVIDSLEILIQPSPDFLDLGEDISNCRDTTLVLNAGSGFDSYLWNDGSNSQFLPVSSPGLFHVVAVNGCQEHFIDSFNLTRSFPNSFQWQPGDVEVCAGDSVMFQATGGNGYLWGPTSSFANPESSNTKAAITSTGFYTLRIVDSVCVRDTLIQIPVVARAKPNIQLTKSNDFTCSTDSAVLNASGASTYLWSPNPFSIRNNGAQITVKGNQASTYTVTGKDDIGCTGKDSIIIAFFNQGRQELYIPNAFTPDGDGLNDFFKPTLIGGSTKYDFRIYNRWGQLVFSTDKPNQGWDGNFRSARQPIGTYVYYLKIEGFCNGVFEKKGLINILK